MQFTSLPFLLFLPVVACGFFVLPRRLKAAFLLCASLAFYWYRNLRYGFFILFSIVITYVAGRIIGKQNGNRQKKIALLCGILLNLSLLLFFKYYNFAASNLAALFGLFGAQSPLPLLDILVPVGISFYTFQSLGYMVDVYRGQTKAEKNLVTYALFVAFFPQVQAGPIGRSTTLLPQLQGAAPVFSAKRVEAGLFMVGWGFFKKLVIADRLAIFVNAVFDEHAGGTGLISLVALVLFALQMYCDFSSYSTIALGAARVLGYTLDENFNLPYFSRSIPEFWRRWHITLGSWFRDYLFYPIVRAKGLNRLAKKAKGVLPKQLAQNLPVLVALLVVWGCTGLWHGAGWNYLLWGLYHGLLIILSTLLGPTLKKWGQKCRLPLNSLPFKLFQTLRTFVLVCIGYVFFRSPSLAAAGQFFANLFRGAGPAALANGGLLAYGLDAPDIILALAALALLFVLELIHRRVNLLQWVPAQRLPLRWAIYLLGLLLIVVFGLYGEGYVEKPFIYFQF